MAVLVLVIATGFSVVSAAPAQAGCTDRIGFASQASVCFSNGAALELHMTSGDGPLFDYEWVPVCENAGICADYVRCEQPDGLQGILYEVSRRPSSRPNAEFEVFATVCLTVGEEERLRVISWERVWRVMKTLEWPQAELVVQPVGGKTLVNFETNFYTTTTEPLVQSVTLWRKRVEIEATPASYTWHWDREGEGLETSNPGAPHVDLRDHEVFHEYLDADVTVHPSVDVTYEGRYRVEGGPWFQIPETLTVPGDPEPLRVITARVILVG